MASLASPSRRQQPAQALSCTALKARDALLLEHLSLADAIASATAWRLFPLQSRRASRALCAAASQGPGSLTCAIESACGCSGAQPACP
jgi:hypothetical protein